MISKVCNKIFYYTHYKQYFAVVIKNRRVYNFLLFSVLTKIFYYETCFSYNCS